MHTGTRSAKGLIVALSLAAACATEAPEDHTLASLTVGVAAPVMQQASTSVGLQYHRDALTRETLVQLGADGRPSPRVLESWTVSADRLSWRLKIRPGIRFHDGTPVTAAELVPALRTRLLAAFVRKIAAVDVEGEDIVIRLHEPFALLPEDLGQMSAVRTVVEKDAEGKTVATHQFGTGPYMLVSESAEGLEVKEFANHYRGDAGVSAISVKLFPDQRNAWSALMRNEIDVLYEVSRDSLDFVRSESTIHVATFPRAFVYVLAFNSAIPSLRNPDVRRAINYAIDRRALVDGALLGEGEPAEGHVWPRYWAHDASVRSPEYNPREAVRLLEAAGFKTKVGGEGRPARLQLRCAVYEPFQKMALIVQRQLAEVDIDLQLEMFGLREMAERAAQGNFDTFLFEMTSGRTMLWPYMFWHSTSPFVKHGYRGADEILERLQASKNDQDMRGATSAFQKRLIDDPPAAFLAWGRMSRAVTKRFELPATDDDIYHTIPRWRLAAANGGD